jgi:hypothetical protein
VRKRDTRQSARQGEELRGRAERGARSSGSPLSPAAASEMSARFGHDFSQVRVHADAAAQAAAADLRADAFTIGSDIVFGAGAAPEATEAGRRLLAHELAHVVQQARGGPADLDAVSDAAIPHPEHASEHAAAAAATAALEGRAAGELAGRVATGGAAVVQRWPWDDEPASGGGDSGGSLWDSVTGAVGGAATAVYEGYQSATDFKGAAAGVGELMDMMSESSDKGNQKMVEQAKGIPVLEQLAEGSAWISNISTQATAGAVKGAADVVGGVAHGMFHPIDAASGMLGLLEHNSPVPFLGSTLKAGHGLWDLAVNDGGQYGNSLGEVANSVFNPLKQQQDDAAYNQQLVTGILAPGDPDKGGGWQAWEDRPVEAGTRALMNVLPFLLGGEGKTPPPIEAPPPTLRTPFAPPGVPAPPSFRPNIPSVRPGVIDPHAPTLPSPAFPPDILPGPATQPSPGILPPSTRTPTIPGLGPIELPPLTEPGMPSFPGLGPGRTPTIPGLGPIDIPPLTEPGIPSFPGIGPGRTPTIPGLNPFVPEFPPELLPQAPPSSGRPVPSSFPEVPSFPSSEFPSPPSSRGLRGVEPEVPSGRPTVPPNAGHELDLVREQQLAEQNRRLEEQGLGVFPPAPAPFRTTPPFPFEPFRPERF